MSYEEEFVGTGKYLGAEWSGVWYKRSCRSNGRVGSLWFDREIEDFDSITNDIVR